ncbi:MAG: hypothetical protein ACRER2_02195, partial [Methylococcales bacterium]
RLRHTRSMRIVRLTTRQTRLTSLLVMLMILVNLLLPGSVAFRLDSSLANFNPDFINGHDQIADYQSESEGDRPSTSDGRDNSSQNLDDFDDFILSATTFVSERGACFESLSLSACMDRNPTPEHRPPERG